MIKYHDFIMNPYSNMLSDLLTEETGVLGENPRPAENHWQTFSHNFVSSKSRNEWDPNLKR